MFTHVGKHVLLLDVDGVIVRNKTLLNTVSRKCVKYVQKKHPMQISDDEAHRINKVLYTQYGHTLLGVNALCEVYPSDSKIDTVRMQRNNYYDFDELVYDNDTMNMLYHFLDSQEFMMDTVSLANMCSCIHSCAYPAHICLFSNAPKKWCDAVANKIHDLYKVKYIDDIICSDHHVFSVDQTRIFKPHIHVYHNVHSHITSKTNPPGSQSQPHKNIVFIDDSIGNLLPIAQNKHWIPIHFSNEATHTHIVPSFGSFRQIEKYIIDKIVYDTKNVSLSLFGGPFVNKDTVVRVIKECIPDLDIEIIKNAVGKAHTYGYSELLRCKSDKAEIYCRRLIDNGFLASID